VVRNSPAFINRDFRCADIHAAVELHCIRVNDFAVQLKGEAYREV
jgi:hypothetical protein